ncbi:hypothetical protein JXL19_06600 [bacterium]|nr:hypothetical protein [bacterium]
MVKLIAKYTLIIIIAAAIIVLPECYAIDIDVQNDWLLTINSTNLQSGAGSDLIPNYQSDSDQISVDINNTNKNWSVSIKGSVTNWHGELACYVRRTSNGTGPGSVSGGTAWQKVTLTDQVFFTGRRQRRNINIQCGLTGMSVQVPPGVYTGTIIYTVTEN